MILESQQLRLEAPVTDRDHVLGPPNARVTVVTYGDYECPACQSRHRATEKMFDKMRGQVRFVYRHFPLLRVHPRALRAAEAAEAAAAQGKFWQMHRLLYSHSNKLRDSELRRHARTIGLDLVRFDRDMASGVYADQIKKNCYESIINGISGAPTTFVNGELFAKSDVGLSYRSYFDGRRQSPRRKSK
jgi:formate-nitrite transporter family protein